MKSWKPRYRFKPGDEVVVGAYKGAIVVNHPSNGWIKLYHPSNVKNGQTREDVTFSARLHWLGERP